MRLARLDLTRYGKFTGGSLDFGERQPGRPDLHIVYGPNEAGKSTAFSAFLDLLFGIETQSDYAFLHPYKTMKIGAALELGGASAKTFGRIKRPQHSLLDAADQPVGDAALLGGIGGLDRAAYRNMFSLDDETLEKGGQTILASKGDLGQLLFSASAGLADFSETLDALRAEADTFYRGRARGELAELKGRLERLKSEREELDTVLPAYRKLVEAREAGATLYEAERAKSAELQTRAHAVDRLSGTLPRYARLELLRERLKPLSDFPKPPATWSEELPGLQREEIELATQLTGCDDEIVALTAARAAIVIDEPVLRSAEQIDALATARDRFTGADKDLPERRRSLADLDAAVAKRLRRLEREDEPDPDRLVLGASVLGTLRDLIEQRSGVAARLETAQRQHADAAQMLAEAEAGLSAAGAIQAEPEAGLGALNTALAAVRASDHVSRRRQAEKARGTYLARLEDGIAALRPWSGTVEQLAAAAPPRATDVVRWKQAEADLAKELTHVADDIERLTAERRRLETERDAAGQFAGVVPEVEAVAVRTRRDLAWAAHRRDLQSATADAFEEALRQDDLVTTARLHRSSEIARLAQNGQRLAVLAAELAQALERRDAAVAARERVASEIATAIQALGWPPTAQCSALDLDEWLKSRVVGLEFFGRLRDEERAIAEADADARHARDQIAAALMAAGAAQAGDASLVDLLAFSEALVERDAAQSGLRAQVAERRSALIKGKRDLTAAKSADADWQRAWVQVCASCWLGEKGAVPAPATVRIVLDVLGELASLLLQRDDLTSRVAKMKADQARFTQDVERLRGELGDDLHNGSALDCAARLSQRLEAAQDGESRRGELSTRLAALLTRRGTLTEALALHTRRTSAMTTFFGVDSLGEVDIRLEQAKERADLAMSVAELEDEIVVALGASSLVAAEAVLASADAAALETERNDLRSRFEDLDRHTHTLYAEFSQASDAVAAIGGDDAVARLAETRRTVLLDTEDRALGYLRVRIGIAAAEQALRAYRDKHRSSMMSRASDAFRTISRGAYTGLAAQPADRGDVLVALGAGASKEASQLSKGTRFQLYLALRVAGYYEYCLSREPVPFIADDIMETFDDFRAEEAFRLFAQMAEVGQVIYLTHHRHLCDIARAVCPGVRITELPGAAMAPRAGLPANDQPAFEKAAKASA